MNWIKQCLVLVTLLERMLAAPAGAQVVREPVFQVPELVGRVDLVSVSPATIVIDGKRLPVAPRIMLTRNGANEWASFAQVANELPGKDIKYGFAMTDDGSRIVDRILVRGAAGAVSGEAASGGVTR